MARKKRKKSGLSRRQLKQQRRKTMVRKRKERSSSSRQGPFKRRNAEVIEDMLPLFTGVGGVSPGLSMDQLMMALLASEDIMDEPEFEDVIIDPVDCVDTLAQVGQELGVDPGALGELAAEEREDTQMRMLEEATQRLLTDELRRNILNALNDLRLRLKGSGKQVEAVRASALKSFLSEDDAGEHWSMIGLVQALVKRSLAVGFEMLEASREVWESDSPVGDDIPLAQKLSQPILDQKVNALLKKVPGLRGFMEKQVDKVWEEGMDALMTGDLSLGLFSQEEIRKGFDILGTALGYQAHGEAAADGLPPLQEPSREQASAIVSQLDGYITELFTQERLGRLRERLDAIIKDSAHMKKWLAFIFMLSEYMAKKDAAVNEKPFLIKALLGEMGAVYEALRKANG